MTRGWRGTLPGGRRAGDEQSRDDARQVRRDQRLRRRTRRDRRGGDGPARVAAEGYRHRSGRGREGDREDLSEFKIAVTKILTKYASAILLDPEYGLEALKVRAP